MAPGRLQDARVILGVFLERKKSPGTSLLAGMPRKRRQTSKAVWSDRYEGGRHAAQEVVGKRMHMVLDRLPVAQWYRNGVETVRQHERPRLQRARSEEA